LDAAVGGAADAAVSFGAVGGAVDAAVSFGAVTAVVERDVRYCDPADAAGCCSAAAVASIIREGSI